MPAAEAAFSGLVRQEMGRIVSHVSGSSIAATFVFQFHKFDPHPLLSLAGGIPELRASADFGILIISKGAVVFLCETERTGKHSRYKSKYKKPFTNQISDVFQQKSSRRRSGADGSNGVGALGAAGCAASAAMKEEPDFVETRCHWRGCGREMGTQELLVKVRGGKWTLSNR